jgi:cytochrome o ubiquinol oxidase subunit 1
MLIPGSLFGYLAGYMYWFPKAFGFRLDERWGRRAFWSWLIGFQLAFLPLYALGLMGMPRRMEHYADPAWQPWLVVALAGVVLILWGVVCLGMQLWVSVRERGRLTEASGDPWNGRTLEWDTASPPAPYNFAVIPEVHDIDALADMKERRVAREAPAQYEDIQMPNNTGAGFVIGALSFFLGFALIWHIWWMAIAGGVGTAFAVVLRSLVDEDEYLIPAAEVARIERNRLVPVTGGTAPSRGHTRGAGLTREAQEA